MTEGKEKENPIFDNRSPKEKTQESQRAVDSLIPNAMMPYKLHTSRYVSGRSMV